MKSLNSLLAVGAALLLAVCADAANIVTYTAQSKVSQKDADQKALEGVAAQVGTKVNSEFSTRTVEQADGTVESTALSKKSVKTNVLLKGAKITIGARKGDLYQSTVTVDLDQLASKILLDLNQIRAQMKSSDSIIRLDMLDRDYRKVSSEMAALEKMASNYAEQLEALSYVQKVPEELKLQSTLGELTDFLTASLSTVKLETDLTSEALMVTVSDFAGPIPNFPVILTQDHRDLVSEKTDDEGTAVFSLVDVMKKKPTGEVTVLPDMDFKFVRPSALVSKTVRYSAEKKDCSYRLVCNASATECGALKKFLIESGFTMTEDAQKPELNTKLEFSDKPNSSRTLYTSKATVTFAAGSVELVEQPQGVGRDAESAHVKAIAKLPATEILQTFVNKACK